jgi:hypothetical protein
MSRPKILTSSKFCDSESLSDEAHWPRNGAVSVFGSKGAADEYMRKLREIRFVKEIFPSDQDGLDRLRFALSS